MKIWFACFAVMCYTSFVSATDLPKMSFNMVAVVVPAKEAAPAAKAVAYKLVTQTTYRNPVSHTHTCPNPNCRTTWDHAVTSGHNCPNCGTYQNIQDSPSRMVTVKKTVRVPVDGTESYATSQPTRPVVQAVPVRQTSVGIQLYRYSTSSGGCANGQCGYAR